MTRPTPRTLQVFGIAAFWSLSTWGCADQRSADHAAADGFGHPEAKRKAQGEVGTVQTEEERDPIRLATGQHAPAAIAISADSVYWLNLGTNPSTDTKTPQAWTDGQLNKCAASGCLSGPTVLTSGRTFNAAAMAPLPLAVSGDHVYWIDKSGLASCKIDGCRPQVLAEVHGGDLSISPSHALWTVGNSVQGCALPTCGTPVVRWSGPGDAGPLVTDGNSMYWGTAGPTQLMKCQQPDCNAAVTLSGPHTANLKLFVVRAIGLDDDNVYVIEGNGALLKCSKDSCQSTLTVLADGLQTPIAVASDGVDVYWTEQGALISQGEVVHGAGSIRKCGVDGCGNAPIVVTSGLERPTDIAVDDHSVYWVEYGIGPDDGRVMKLLK